MSPAWQADALSLSHQGSSQSGDRAFKKMIMNLEIIRLSEISQTENNKYQYDNDKYQMTIWYHLHVKSRKKNCTNELIYKTDIELQMVENKLTVTKGEKGGVIHWDIRIHIDILLCIKQITNKDLLYSTGNSTLTQYSVMAYMGKESKKEWYMFMYGAFPVAQW